MSKKLIYILNQYSHNNHTHFYHVLHLLEVMANKGIAIALVIEKCDHLPTIYHRGINLYPQEQKIKWLRPLELFKMIIKLKGQGYDHIFIRISWVAAIVSILAGWFTGQKTFYWLSGQGGFENYKNLSFGINKIKLFIKSRLPFIFIKSFVYRFFTGPESMKEYFIKEGNVNEKKIEILYNDIDLNRFKCLNINYKNDLKKKLNINLSKKIIFFAHRFSPVRKTSFYIPYIFEMFLKKVDNFVIMVAGNGPDEREIKSMIALSQIKDKIIFLGSIPNALIQEYYQIADIFINPTYAEGFPRVLIEAMASGLPVVTTNAGGIKDIVGEEQARFMVPKEDRELFAEKLIQLANSPNEREIIKKENLKTVQRFSTEVVVDMYINKIFKKSN